MIAMESITPQDTALLLRIRGGIVGFLSVIITVIFCIYNDCHSFWRGYPTGKTQNFATKTAHFAAFYPATVAGEDVFHK